MQENVERFPKLKAFLWTLSSRNMTGKKYHIAKQEELEEQTKLTEELQQKLKEQEKRNMEENRRYNYSRKNRNQVKAHRK